MEALRRNGHELQTKLIMPCDEATLTSRRSLSLDDIPSNVLLLLTTIFLIYYK